MDQTVVVALISLAGVVTTAVLTNSLIKYRIDQLEKKVDKHNNLIERTYKLEEDAALHEAELKRQNERIKILEGESK